MIDVVAVGSDGSPTADRAVAVAAEMARRFDAKLVLLGAAHADNAAASVAGLAAATGASSNVELDWATNAAARLRHALERTERRLQREGIECESALDIGPPADVLVRLAEEVSADVLVVGSKGMQRRVLGSVPNTVTHRAPCSVLVVKTT